MRFSVARRPLLAILFCCLLSACANSRLASTWRAADDSGGPVQNIAIFAVLRDPSSSEFIENEAVRRMPPPTKAAAGHLLKVEPTLNEQQVRTRLEQAGFDSAIVTRLVSIDETETYYPPEVHFVAEPLAFSARYRSFWTYYPFAGASVVTPGYTVKNRRYIIETILYRLPDGKPVWSAVSETLNPRSTLTLVNEVVGLITKQLQRTGLIETR